MLSDRLTSILSESMKAYRRYKADEFVADESFQRWQTGRSPQDTAFWEQWKLDNPDCLGELQRAERLLTSLRLQYPDDLTPATIEQETRKLVSWALESDQLTQPTRVRPLITPWRWAAAACVLVGLSVGGWYYQHQRPQRAISSPAPPTVAAGLQERVNNSAQPVNVLLSDGSLVVLGPKSRLSYPQRFGSPARAVYLTGEAFFEVVKNPARPFLVYTTQTVVKVLGTSFSVRADGASPVRVAVRTGRVSVYGRLDYETAQRAASRRVRGLVLTPNQQAIYSPAVDTWQRSLVEEPLRLESEAPSQRQTFEEAPVARILATLERSYGVDLVFDEEGLARCPLTTSFVEENLLERIDIVCQAIGASYEVLDGQIVITSQRCH